jgi:hypothetical protein
MAYKVELVADRNVKRAVEALDLLIAAHTHTVGQDSVKLGLVAETMKKAQATITALQRALTPEAFTDTFHKAGLSLAQLQHERAIMVKTRRLKREAMIAEREALLQEMGMIAA